MTAGRRRTAPRIVGRVPVGPRQSRSDQTVLEQIQEQQVVPGRTPGEMERLGGSDMTGWQRTLGNQAVTRQLQPGGKFNRGSSPDPRRTGSRTSAKPALNAAGGSQRRDPFSNRARSDGQGAMDGKAAQRYVTSAGFSLLGNKVEFESSGLAGTIAAAMNLTKSGSGLRVSSSTYTGTGTVKATGDKANVKNFELGFLQTVYRSDRTFFYEPEAYAPSVPEQIGTFVAPSIFSNRYKVTDTLSTLPVRDGDAGFTPWYGPETVVPFGEAASSTKTTSMNDTPGTAEYPWKKVIDGKNQWMVKTGGADVFRSWLSVQEKGTDGILGMHRLGHIDWKFDYGADVAVNKGAPASSTVTPTTGAGTVIGVNEGPGAKLPFMGDPVANDVTQEIEGSW